MLTHNRVAGLFVATALVAFQVADASAAARKPGCQAAKIRVAGGCVSRAAAANHIVAITRETMRHLRIKAAIRVRSAAEREPLPAMECGGAAGAGVCATAGL